MTVFFVYLSFISNGGHFWLWTQVFPLPFSFFDSSVTEKIKMYKKYIFFLFVLSEYNSFNIYMKKCRREK